MSSDDEFEIKLKEMENYIKTLRESQQQKKLIKPIKLDLDLKYIEQMKKEGRWFEKGDPDYEESLKHPWGISKENWYIKK
jgi:hypothetical protein